MKKSQSVSIVDVANRAGLSATTVSRVLNKKGYFSEETARKVEIAVEELGYRPNWWARGLKGQPSKLVGLIIPDILNVFYTTIASSMLQSLRKYGYEMILCVSEEDPEKDFGYLQILEEKHVDGIIYAHPTGGSNSNMIRKLVAKGMPIIEINRQSEKDHLDAVLVDNLRGTQDVMEYLIGLGHKRISLITGGEVTITGAERIAGYRSSLHQAGLTLDPDLLKVGSFTRAHGEKAAEELLALDNPTTAIFAGSNRIALGVLYILGRKKIKIPDEMSIVAFDDAEWLAAWNPPITAVDIAILEMTQLAVELLNRRITGEMISLKPVSYHLRASLVVRQSCREITSPDLLGNA